MRTTITLPDPLAQQVRELASDGSLSDFIRTAVQEYVCRLERDVLARDLEAGYRAEARDSSLDPEWTRVETEGW